MICFFQLQVWIEVRGAGYTLTCISWECECVVGILSGLCRVLGRALGLEKPYCGLESGPGALKTAA